MPRTAPFLPVLAVLASGCLPAPSSPVPTRISFPDRPGGYTLPTELCGGYFVVRAEVNGRGPWDLLLDSGAGRTALDPVVLREAGVRGAVDSLRVGEFVAFGVAALELDMEELSGALGREVHGIVGHPVFAGALLTWDLAGGEILLARGSLSPSGPEVYPTRPDRRPFVRAEVGGDSLWILLDTGSSRGLTLRGAERLAYLDPPRPTGARVRVDGVHPVLTGRLDGEARIGPLRVEAPVIANSVSTDLVGQEILRHARLTFDQQNHLVRIERPGDGGEGPIPSPPVRTPGFSLRPVPGGAEVFRLLGDLAPEGIEEGDRVLEVDGVAWTARGCPGERESGDTVRFRLQRGDSTFSRSVRNHELHPLPRR